MTTEDVLEVFFEADTTIYNSERERFQSTLGRRCLYWGWYGGKEGADVVVFSCFEKEEDDAEV